MKLIKIKTIKGTIQVMTGLRVGGSDAGMEIGGMDNPIIRNKVNGEPYIPGSSLKGKMRSLMEWECDRLHPKGETHQCSTNEEAKGCPICRVFGIAASSSKNMDDPKTFKLGPTRLVVRDAVLSKKSRRNFEQGLPITEEKSENSINRITAVANPRPIERVVPGVEFDFEITFKIIDLDDGGETDKKNFDLVRQALTLVEEDYLGGGGSRGSGKVKFINLEDETGKKLDLETAWTVEL